MAFKERVQNVLGRVKFHVLLVKSYDKIIVFLPAAEGVPSGIPRHQSHRLD